MAKIIGTKSSNISRLRRTHFKKHTHTHTPPPPPPACKAHKVYEYGKPTGMIKVEELFKRNHFVLSSIVSPCCSDYIGQFRILFRISQWLNDTNEYYFVPISKCLVPFHSQTMHICFQHRRNQDTLRQQQITIMWGENPTIDVTQMSRQMIDRTERTARLQDFPLKGNRLCLYR